MEVHTKVIPSNGKLYACLVVINPDTNKALVTKINPKGFEYSEEIKAIKICEDTA